ncbi:MAG: hypothetical protein WBG08_11715 [Litorimonas sp.]
MTPYLIGISLGLVFGYVSLRYEEFVFGASGFVGVVQVFDEEIAEPLILSRVGLGHPDHWDTLVTLSNLLPDGYVTALMIFFITLVLARCATWLWLKATWVDPETLPPECRTARRKRILSEFGYTEQCIRKLQQESRDYHAKWGRP